MESLNKQEEFLVVKLIAKEILEYRLGVAVTNENIHLLANHILQFEKEISSQLITNEHLNTIGSMRAQQKRIKRGVRKCA